MHLFRLSLSVLALSFLVVFTNGCSVYESYLDEQDLRSQSKVVANPVPAVSRQNAKELEVLKQDVAQLRLEMRNFQDAQRQYLIQLAELQGEIAQRDKQIEELRGLVASMEAKVQTSDSEWKNRMAQLRTNIEAQHRKSMDAMAKKMAKEVEGVVKQVEVSQPATDIYVVQSGDTLSGIATAYGITVKKLQALNGLKDSRIRVNQKLKIPAR